MLYHVPPRWYEVASLKRGFAGEGQGDCHCTQGIYTARKTESGSIQLDVSTFCVHGGPDGRLSGIQGQVGSRAAGAAPPQLVPAVAPFLVRPHPLSG